MKIEDTIWQLAHSTNPEDKREWAVLYWKSQRLKHEEIAEKWAYSIQWVQRYMTRAYKRFEVPPHLNKYEKIQYLEENVFPLMRKFIASEPDTIKELPAPPTESVPDDDSEQTEETSEEPPIIEILPPKRLPPPRDPWKRIRQLFFAGVSLLIVSMVGYYAYNLGRGNAPEPQTIIVTATFPPITDTLIPSATLLIPTETSPPTATNTQVPTNTPIPTQFIPPADGILFQDNFDTGLSSEWTQITGTWIVSDGKLTKLADDNSGIEYQWIALNKVGWKNYILSMDLNKSYNNPVAVIVRDNTFVTQPIGFHLGWGDNIELVLISNKWTDDVEIAGQTDASVEEKSDVNIQIEVNGDTYILRLNGREIQRVTLTGYSSGGIKIGNNCTDAHYGCTTFDNFKVTYLP